MIKKSLLCFLAVIVLVQFSDSSLAERANAEKEALKVAELWLKLVDDGKYEDSWKQAAGYFKIAVKQKDWLHAMQSVREPLGSVISRKLKFQQYATSLPGAPDGEYVVIQYETSFTNKHAAIETITPMKDQDGQWRTSGYYIK